MQILLLIIGFVIIIKASDFLVDASSALALKLRVPKMLIALTIAAFGTCAPEIAISFQSVSAGNGEIAFANVVGIVANSKIINADSIPVKVFP